MQKTWTHIQHPLSTNARRPWDRNTMKGYPPPFSSAGAWFWFKRVLFYLQWDIRSFLWPTRFISPLPAFHFPYSSSKPCLHSFQDSQTHGRLISIQIIKAFQPGCVVHPFLNLFWDATLCCVITSFISPRATAHTWSELDARSWKQGHTRPMDQKSIAGNHDKWGARPGVRKQSWTNQPFIRVAIVALLWPQWVALCMHVCCVEIDR